MGDSHGLDHSRDPCPWVALSDFGGAFCMGAIGGAIWHGVKGFRNSPYGERRIGGMRVFIPDGTLDSILMVMVNSNHSDQSKSSSARRQFWWSARRSRRPTSHQKRRHRLCDSPCCHRRGWHRDRQNDGREYKVGDASTSTKRRERREITSSSLTAYGHDSGVGAGGAGHGRDLTAVHSAWGAFVFCYQRLLRCIASRHSQWGHMVPISGKQLKQHLHSSLCFRVLNCLHSDVIIDDLYQQGGYRACAFLVLNKLPTISQTDQICLKTKQARSRHPSQSCACRTSTSVISAVHYLHVHKGVSLLFTYTIGILSNSSPSKHNTQLADARGHAHRLAAGMAEDTPSRQMSLIPRRGNAVVTRDPNSQQLSVNRDSESPLDLTECPYCHRPWANDNASPRGEERGRTGRHSDHAFLDPEYFRMLAASRRATPTGSGSGTPNPRLFQPALRSGRSRDVSGATGPPTGAEFVTSEPADPSPRERISSSAFSPGFFKQFFVEKGELGRGGNGVVLLIEHVMDRVSLGEFACKRIPVGNDHAWLEKVLVEVQLLKKIPHKNLVAYHWVWLEDYNPSTFGPRIPCLWILQEFCNGGDLHSFVIGPKEEEMNPAELLKQRRRRRSTMDSQSPPSLRWPSRLTFDDIFSFFRDITSGLHHLHSKGYIHRDLKPSNCLLQRDDSKIRVLISDFGEVQAAGGLRTSTGATGTISYCAPEVLRQGPDGKLGDFTTKSDIFSLGMIVYFMCFGRLPYSNADDINEENEDLVELRAEITRWTGFDDETRVRPDLPEKLYRFLKRLLSVAPAERPSTDDILASIKGGGGMGDSGDVEGSIPRVSSLNRALSDEHRGSFMTRPNVATSLGRQGSSNYHRSTSPMKGSVNNAIDRKNAITAAKPALDASSTTCACLRPPSRPTLTTHYHSYRNSDATPHYQNTNAFSTMLPFCGYIVDHVSIARARDPGVWARAIQVDSLYSDDDDDTRLHCDSGEPERDSMRDAHELPGGTMTLSSDEMCSLSG
nr:putative serine/threonine-protein kinase iksa [Quercus suber]